ncbi:MAG: hypothetical protein LBH20_06055 [Treponema sp.]|jgi:hypothetical protein|nr:hypothetical protein [Treponema sp.]
MKTIGRFGSSSECTVFSEDSFILRGECYERDIYNGRYYRLETSRSLYSQLGRESGLARRRISAALFALRLNECKKRITEWEKKYRRTA